MFFAESIPDHIAELRYRKGSMHCEGRLVTQSWPTHKPPQAGQGELFHVISITDQHIMHVLQIELILQQLVL